MKIATASNLRRLFIYWLMNIYLVCFCCQVSIAQTTAARKTDTTDFFTYKIIEGSNGTFGYDIYVDEKLKVHQPSKPALSGNDGFKTKTAAEKVAQLVIQKMKKGEMPPTITVEELKKLKAI